AADCERALFETLAASGDKEGAEVAAFDLLASRQLLQGDAQGARRLLDAAPTGGCAALPRRVQSTSLRQRLRGLAANRQGRPPAAWRSLWLACRASRGGGCASVAAWPPAASSAPPFLPEFPGAPPWEPHRCAGVSAIAVKLRACFRAAERRESSQPDPPAGRRRRPRHRRAPA